MANLNIGRKSGFIIRGGVKRRETVWFNAVFALSTLAAGTPVLLSQLSAAGLALRPFTVIRTRGMLEVGSDQEAADEAQLGAYGACVVSDQAVAIGITAVPTPITDSDSDLWFAYQMAMTSFKFGDATGFANVGKSFEIESKGMRKVEEGQDMIEVIENSSVGSGLNMLVGARQLIKLH